MPGAVALQSGQRNGAGQHQGDPLAYSYERWFGRGKDELRLSVSLDTVVVRGEKPEEGDAPRRDRVLRVRRPRGQLPRETASGYSHGEHRCVYPKEEVELARGASRE